MTTLADVRKYASTLNERLDLEDRVKELKSQEAKLHDSVLAYFEAEGIQKVSVEGRTLFARRELWAKRKDTATNEDVVAALEAESLSALHEDRPSWTSISSYLRELDRDGTPIPATLASVVEASEVWKVGHRKASQR